MAGKKPSFFKIVSIAFAKECNGLSQRWLETAGFNLYKLVCLYPLVFHFQRAALFLAFSVYSYKPHLNVKGRNILDTGGDRGKFSGKRWKLFVRRSITILWRKCLTVSSTVAAGLGNIIVTPCYTKEAMRNNDRKI